MAEGNDDGKLIATLTNLLQVKDPVRLADGVAAHALLLEKKGRSDQAQAAWAHQPDVAGAPWKGNTQALLHIAGTRGGAERLHDLLPARRKIISRKIQPRCPRAALPADPREKCT